MSRASRADWAPAPKWSDITDIPPTTIADVEGLQAALAARVLTAALSQLAFTGRWADILGKPVFGSAAFADVSTFLLAYTAKTLQIGEVAMVANQQSYAVVFTTTMDAIPKIELQCSIDDVNGEMTYAVLQKDSITTSGFTFWLSSSPSTSDGSVFYRAVVQSQP